MNLHSLVAPIAPLLAGVLSLACGGTAADRSSTTGNPSDAAGGAIADAGPDSPKDALDGSPVVSLEAAVDAPTCPTFPTRLQPCPDQGQVCVYGCGTVFLCTTRGWDYDDAVDAGPPCP